MENFIEKAIAFTGHRDIKYADSLPMIVELNKELVFQIAGNGFNTFYTGMERGFDLNAAAVVLALRAKYNIKLVAVLPFMQQAERFNSRDKKRYFDILTNCNKIICLHDKYQKGCYFERNSFLVDHAERIIAYHDGRSGGGTTFTIGLAKKKGKNIVNIYDQL